MLNKEKIKNFLKNPEFKFWTIVVLLLIIAKIQLCFYLKTVRAQNFFKRISNDVDVLRNNNIHPAKKNLRRQEKIKELERRFEEELSELDRHLSKKEKELRNFDKTVSRKIARQQGEFVFRLKDRYDEEKKEFVVTFKVPTILKLEEVEVDLEDDILAINIEKKHRNKDGIFYNSLTQAFKLPETKAKLEDIKITLDDTSSTVTVVVPII
ncbi:MAG: Hsp20/alpha crystallin family protein [Rickettsiales bacterium]|jgi:HSP20 family molecular chaperone IbpA|nr:Hsp20/alpha crystallin family protein [Rickettsiales bacterium]